MLLGPVMADAIFATELVVQDAQYNARMEAAAQSAMTASQRIQSTFRETGVEMARSLGKSVDQVNDRWNGMLKLAQAYKGVAVAAAAATAIAMGVKAVADDAAELSKSAIQLGKALGISTSEASVLNVALGDVYLTTETMIAANDKLTRTLREDEEAVTALGVRTRDQNGEFRKSLDIMLDVNKRLLDFKEGVDRNIEGQKIYGRAWSEMSGTLRLTSEVMEDSRRKAEELGLIVGTENVEATTRYRAALNDVGDVFSALKKTIGDALMPVLTKLGEWFSAIGPAAVVIIKGAVGGLISLFWGLKNAVVIVWETINAMVVSVAEPLRALAETLYRLVRGDIKGAAEALKNIPTVIANAWVNAGQRMVDSSRETRDRLWDLFATQSATASPAGGLASEGGGKGKPKGKEDKKAASRLAEWESELAAQRDAYDRMMLAQDSFQEFTKAMERDFWKSILDTKVLTDEERLAVAKKFYAMERELRKESFEAEIADLKGRAEAFRAGSVERIRIAGEVAARIGEKFGQESKEYKAALAEMRKAAEENQKELLRIEAERIEREREYRSFGLDLAKEELRFRKEMGDINRIEELQALREMEETRYQIELQALEERLRLLDVESAEYEKLLLQKEKLTQAHQLALVQNQNEQTLAMKARWGTVFDAVTNGFSTAIKGVIMGTQTLGQAIRNILQTVMLAILDMGIKMIAQWVLNALFGKMIEKASAISKIGANAAVAASAAFAATAAIPIVGPALAPAAASAAYAETLAWIGAIPAAARGWDIPAGLNPVTRLHEREMVLPADIADPLRQSLGTGSVGGPSIMVHVTAMDSRDVVRALKQGGALNTALRDAYRGFAISRG